jgi:histidinol-phosphate aminotransferase
MRFEIDDLIRSDVASLKPYIVKDVPYKIKMDANENPYNIPENIKDVIAKEIYNHHFNRYPDPSAFELRQALSSQLNVDTNKLVIGNGSDELISYIISAFGGNKTGVIFPTPTFSIYGIFADVWGTKSIGVPLSKDFELKQDEIISKMDSVDKSIVFISHPNNPTGNCFSNQGIMDIIEHESKSIIVLDEAYYEFSGNTFLPLLDKYENLVILRTFSKAYGLAGLRVGYMIANESITKQIMKVKMVYNINSLSQKIALILLNHKDQMSGYINQILRERDRLINGIDKIDGIKQFHSDANFILFRTNTNADELFSAFLENGILIRNLNEKGLLENCLRVTVGKPEENDAFLTILESQ